MASDTLEYGTDAFRRGADQLLRSYRAIPEGAPIRLAQGAIARIATKDYPVPAPRPSNSRMETHKLRQAFGVNLPHWHEGVEEVLAKILQGDGCAS